MVGDCYAGMPKSITFKSTKDAYEKSPGLQSNDDKDKICNKMLVDQCDDFVHVLTLKGTILFTSASITKLLGYGVEELIDCNIADICHPSDLNAFMREIKEASNSEEPFYIIYRVKNKFNQYEWMEVSGQFLSKQTKGRKCAVLSGRIRPMYQLSFKILDQIGGLNNNEFWVKLSLDGIFLYITSDCHGILGYDNVELSGNSVHQFIRPNNTATMTDAIEKASNGNIVNLELGNTN